MNYLEEKIEKKLRLKNFSKMYKSLNIIGILKFY